MHEVVHNDPAQHEHTNPCGQAFVQQLWMAPKLHLVDLQV